MTVVDWHCSSDLLTLGVTVGFAVHDAAYDVFVYLFITKYVT